MATYVIGDVQGCYDELQLLLAQINFNPNSDKLWFAGDLVNRGPKSLEVLRFVKELGDRAITVLGNHDLHLIATWRQSNQHPNLNDSLSAIFEADDCDELLHWLCQQPLMHRDEKLGYSLVHAGLPPQWSIEEALGYASEVEQVLRGEQMDVFLRHMYGNKPNKWHCELRGWKRLRFIVNSFTRLRYCTEKGKLKFKYKGAPGSQNTKQLPWFQIKNRRSQAERIIFGHWSTLGLYQQDKIYSIDSGCLWGGALTALEIDHDFAKVHQIQCSQSMTPANTTAEQFQ